MSHVERVTIKDAAGDEAGVTNDRLDTNSIIADAAGDALAIDGSGRTTTLVQDSAGDELAIDASGRPAVKVQDSNGDELDIDATGRVSTVPNDYYRDVAMGDVTGSSVMSAIGERENVGTSSTGEDIWMGAATTIPTPDAAGEQMEVVSSDANDTSAGTGVRTVRIHYLDENGDEGTEDVTLNGVTGVALVETNVRFVNDMYALTVGSTGVAEGDITIYKQGASSTIYNMIATGGNNSMVPHRMVPNAKTLYLKEWNASEGQGQRQSIRIRSTDMNGTLLSGVFCFKGAAYLNKTTSPVMQLNLKIPALSIVKVSSWASVVGGEVTVNWWGVLVDD